LSWIRHSEDDAGSSKPAGTLTVYKAKAIPLQTWTDPEGFSRLRLPEFKAIGT